MKELFDKNNPSTLVSENFSWDEFEARHVDSVRPPVKLSKHELADLEAQSESLETEEAKLVAQIKDPHFVQNMVEREIESATKEIAVVVAEMEKIKKQQSILGRLLKRDLPPEYERLEEHFFHLQSKLILLDGKRLHPDVVHVGTMRALKSVREKIARIALLKKETEHF